MILVTGFEPFTTGQGLKLDHNPTGDIAMAVASRLDNAHGNVLPVSYAKTKASLLDLFEKHRPTHWLGMGFAPHRRTIDVEVVALNLEHAVRGDNDGDTPTLRPIHDDAPVAYRCAHDLSSLVNMLDGQSEKAQLNFHAGTFLCNQVYFLACHEVHQGRLETATFVHVPPMSDYKAFEAALTEYLRSL